MALKVPSTISCFAISGSGAKNRSRSKVDITALEKPAAYERMVVVEFPDKDSALAWYHSDEYRDLRDIRWKSADAHIVLVPGETKE